MRAESTIVTEEENLFSNEDQIKHFAETVLASEADAAVVYGIEGPWGVGKTSFVNLAYNYWNKIASNEVIVFRFEILRYASVPDIVSRLIQELSSEIQNQVFAPEFRPAANRYSRMLNGNVDFSFLGFQLSLSPSSDTVEELLDDIDSVLEQINRRLIIVIDDLDRIESQAIKNVLFAVRRTFRLKRVIYILCYDHDRLLSSGEDDKDSHLFLEKFVNVKFSLFINSSDITGYLRFKWIKEEHKYPSIPSETMLRLQAVLAQLAELIESDNGSNYLELVGDLRKIKRFVNTTFLMQLEKTDFSHTDFDVRDLINLILLHLNYPGVFRRIFNEETRGRTGIFSVIRDYSENKEYTYKNSDGFEEYFSTLSGTAKFLIRQLFDVKILELEQYGELEEATLASRACFNSPKYRNLESYLELIVNLSKPEPRDTFNLYKTAVTNFIKGDSISSILSTGDFDLRHGNKSHDEFWRVLVSQAYDFNTRTANDSIEMLIKFIPRYSSVSDDDRGLRHRSVYNLIRLLDRAGWGRTDKNRRNNSKENIIEISYRIFGDDQYLGRGLIERLASEDRGILGIHDLLLFRLQCSADRQGQVYNLQNSLLLHENIDAKTSGPVNELAIEGMRVISQRVFSLFKSRYIDDQKNLFDELDQVTLEQFFGELPSEAGLLELGENGRDSVEANRSAEKSFIIYQLINKKAGNKEGVGCGFYDQVGKEDKGEIAELMNNYLFEVCFNPDLSPNNTNHFLDYCLMKFSSPFWSNSDAEGYHPTSQSISSELEISRLVQYWVTYKELITNENYQATDTRVITFNYIASYKESLPDVFNILDQIQENFDLESKNSE